MIVSALLVGAPLRTIAQEATPAAGPPARDISLLRGLGLPEINLVATDTDVTGVPVELAVGRYLVTLENRIADQNVGIVFLAVPAGITDEAALQGILREGLPAWFYDATWAGGPIADGRQTDAAVVELAAGGWWIDVDRSANAAVQPADTATKLQVTGDLPAAGDIAGAIPVTLTEYSFTLPTGLVAGPQIWQVTNAGTQPHFLDLQGLPDGTTLGQVMDLIGFAFAGTPAASALGLEDTRNLYATPNLSAGQTTWIEIDLAPGTYAVACFVPDQATHAPHALMGMVRVFAVG
jgi:hypothetical protein